MQVLIIDDWGPAVLTAPERRGLLTILEDRHGRASTIVTSPLPVEHWHEVTATQPSPPLGRFAAQIPCRVLNAILDPSFMTPTD